VEAVDEGAFRAVVAVWAGEDGTEIVERTERLEALLAMWTGDTITETSWSEAHAVARDHARRSVLAMIQKAAAEEQAALRRQVEAARRRLLRELARFMACSADGYEAFNVVFHRAMQRGGQVAALLVRAHVLVGYPDWPDAVVRDAVEHVAKLTTNQRKNVLLGTPVEAAVRDPRWVAVATLEALQTLPDGSSLVRDVK
jgi:hypothetical protein